MNSSAFETTEIYRQNLGETVLPVLSLSRTVTPGGGGGNDTP